MAKVPDTASTVARQLSERVLALRLEEMPDNVIAMAKRLVTDQIGVQLRGSALPNVQPVRRLAESLGGTAEATAAGSATLIPASQAAWVNGTLGHSAEYDDAHMAAWHTSSAVVPAAVALAERDDVAGAGLLAAVVAGVQVMGVLGSVAGAGMLAAGWHGSKVLGVFGAAAAAGYLLGLDERQLTSAFGIAASDAGGTMEYDRSGGEVKRMHAGSAARIGTEAALLAQLGLTGPATIFEGHRGVFAMFGGVPEGTVPDAQAWDRWQILDTMFRFIPAIAATHPPLDALRKLREAHGVSPQDVQAIRVGLPAWVVGHGAAITRPRDAISAQFSLAWGIALQLVTGGNRPQDYFDQDLWTDPRLLAIADLVEPVAMDIPAGDPGLSARVEVTLLDGTRLAAYQPGFRGHTTWPATDGDIAAKFRANSEGVITAGAADALLDTLGRLDKLSAVRELTAMLRPGW
jgi:2-methylcitrate dehydratase PrpD